MTNKEPNLIEPIVNSFLAAGSMVFELTFKCIEKLAFKASTNIKEEGIYQELPVFAEIPNYLEYRPIRLEGEALSFVIGIQEDGTYCKIDMFKDNHLLIVGATGQGKSNALACIDKSLKHNYSSDALKIIYVDFKKLDLINLYNKDYAIGNIVTTMDQLVKMIDWLEKLVFTRNEDITKLGKKNWHEYNKVAPVKMQAIVVLVDELARISLGNKKLQNKLFDLLGICRASGIYFICTTQDAAKETIGRCKIHFNQTLGFKVATEVDSTTAIGSTVLNDIEEYGRAYLKRRASLAQVQVMEVN